MFSSTGHTYAQLTTLHFHAPFCDGLQNTPLIENAVMNSLEGTGDYGKHRLWGAVSFGLTSLLGGVLISQPAVGFRCAALPPGMVRAVCTVQTQCP
jgi:hypothetical protein